MWQKIATALVAAVALAPARASATTLTFFLNQSGTGPIGTAGTITLDDASEGPNTRTVQLFINLKDNPKLDTYGSGFPPIAEIVDGLNIAESLFDGYGEGAPSGRGESLRRAEASGECRLLIITPRVRSMQRAESRSTLGVQSPALVSGVASAPRVFYRGALTRPRSPYPDTRHG